MSRTIIQVKSLFKNTIIFTFELHILLSSSIQTFQLLNILNGTMSIVGPRPAAVDQVDVTRGGENAVASTVPCGLTSQSSLWDYIYGDQFTDEREYNEKVLPIRLKLDVYYVRHASFLGDLKLILWTVIAIAYTACGKYPHWMHDKLVEYSKTV